MKLKRGKVCNAAQVKKLRLDSPGFQLKGEIWEPLHGVYEMIGTPRDHDLTYEERMEADSYPSSYPSDDFLIGVWPKLKNILNAS